MTKHTYVFCYSLLVVECTHDSKINLTCFWCHMTVANIFILCVHRQIQVDCVFNSRSKSAVCSPADPSQLCVHRQIRFNCVFTGRSKSALCSPADPSQLCVHRQIQVNCVFTRRFKLTKVIGFSKSCMGCQVNNNLWKLVPETL